MNSVHEPGSRTMSKNLTQEKYQVKSGQKQVECTKCTALGQPARPCRALPCACRASAPPLRPALTRPAACSARPRAHDPCAPYAPNACPACAQRRVVAWLAVSQPCVTTQSSSPLSLLSQYNFCIAIQIFPASLPVTIQYSLAIQLNPHLCHSSLSKTTILQYNLAFLLQYTWD